MAAIYTVFTSPNHAPIPNHLPTLIVTPHGQPSNILYSYLHTNFNAENFLLTPSPNGDLCVAKLFPPPRNGAKSAASDPGHSSLSSRAVRCEASRNLKWTIQNTGVMSPIYKLSLPSPDSPDLPLFQVSKPNPNAAFWSMFYFAYAGHLIPPKRIEFGKIQKNPPGPGGGGTRISITGKTPEEKAVWQTLGEGNEDCVEWVVLCAALNLLDDEILKAAEKAGPPPPMPQSRPSGGPPPAGRGGPPPQGPPHHAGGGPHPQRPGPPQQQHSSQGNLAANGGPNRMRGPSPAPGQQRQQYPLPQQGQGRGQGPPPPQGQGRPYPPQQQQYGPDGRPLGPPPPQQGGYAPQFPPARSGSAPPPQGQQQQQIPPGNRRI